MPTAATMNSVWSMAPSMARRTAGLSKGGRRWLGRRNGAKRPAAIVSTVILLLRLSDGSRSGAVSSHQSISPDCSAAAAVAGSGMTCHSTRSKWATFGPAVASGTPPLQGT